MATPTDSKPAATKTKPSNGTPQTAENMEPKDKRWKRLANMRLPKAVKAIRNVANLSNRSTYEYTEEQVAKLLGVLKGELSSLEQRYRDKKAADTVEAIF